MTGVQTCALPIYTEHQGALRKYLAAAKTTALVEHVRFALDNGLLAQTVVFGWHTAPLTAVTDALNRAGIAADMLTGATSQKRRVEIQDEFRRGHTRVIVGNILAAGTAIDLSAASHGYFLELDWLPANNTQAANRLVSLQKMLPVSFDVATWPGSFDEKLQGVLMRRSKELASFI